MISWKKPGLITPNTSLYQWLLLTNILITAFLAVFSATATIIAEDLIQGELALSNRKAIWITTFYLLGINTVVPAANWFADRFGYKKIYCLGTFLFVLASKLAVFSTNFPMIGSARLLEGIGAGLIFTTGLAMIAQNFKGNQLSFALILYVTAAFGGGIGLGMPLAGYFSQFYSWRAPFEVLFFTGTLTLILCWLVNEETERTEFNRFDFWGYLFFAGFISTLLIALTYGPLPSTNEGWRSPFIFLCFFLALVCFILTIYIEAHHEDPIIPLSLFKDPVFAISSVSMFLIGMSIFGSASTIVSYMLHGLNYERFVVGKIAITYGASIAFFSIFCNILMKKIPAQILTFLGLTFLILSYFLNNTLSWLTGPTQIFWVLLLRGTGVGLSLGPITVLAMQKVPEQFRNKAATLLTFFRQVGGTYGGVLISILVIKREIFHMARFSEQTNPELPAYQKTFQSLLFRFYNLVSDNGLLESKQQVKAAIVNNLQTQAFITAQNDALIIFGIITFIVALILLIFMILPYLKSKKEKSSTNLS